MFENQSIIAEELELLKADIIKVYNESGKRTSGEFEQGLEITNTSTSGTLSGYLYLGGRAAGKQPPIQAIENWIELKGITPIEAKMKTSTLAYLIARKIAKEGTRKENHLFIYDQVITPERIDKIFERLSEVNVNVFINEVTIMIEKLVKNR
ncbi:hypothetical protein [Flavobacterium sedimenticola]|uniref:Uncharacterized protein n=1 Tax=Flavobacterium sedimenticola TaxID=3043286 RepID=A0ABT6XQB0_9FLAO|nr:hypothetical protein [Flavobacterium sedimenticola]MDI9257279.1 hypothetical protein [Flavobacterium sedimenticola]